MPTAMNHAGRLPRDLKLFWVSCFMLFFEILMIRWVSAEVRIFSYFHNLVLLFAFLGIGLGAALAGKKAYILISFILMTVLTTMLGLEHYLGFPLLRNISRYLGERTNFIIWHNKPKPLSLFVRASYLTAGSAMLLALATLITVFFIPFGQVLGKLFNEYERPLRSCWVRRIHRGTHPAYAR